MLDVVDFIAERDGDPKKVRESQRLRFAPESAVDQVIELYEVHRRTKYAASQVATKINATQKEIGAKKKAKEDASELLKKKTELDKEKRDLEDAAAAKDAELQKKIGTIGNYVDKSVPVSNDEVWLWQVSSSVRPR